MSLFEENGLMRKSSKYALAKYLDQRHKSGDSLPENTVFVVDGEHLLHKVVRQFPPTYRDIFQQYIRRSGKNLQTSNVIYDDNTATTLNKEQFLSN